jgi:ketosteroid isomerase-like protein
MNSNAEIDTLKKVVDARGTALANANVDAVVEPLARDAVVYDLQPPLASVGAAARDVDGLRSWLKTWESPPRVELRDPQILLDGDLAVVYGLSRMRGEKVKEGPVDLWFRTTLVFKRSKSGWAIVHEHNSVPMKMDGSGLAAVDLKP